MYNALYTFRSQRAGNRKTQAIIMYKKRIDTFNSIISLVVCFKSLFYWKVKLRSTHNLFPTGFLPTVLWDQLPHSMMLLPPCLVVVFFSYRSSTKTKFVECLNNNYLVNIFCHLNCFSLSHYSILALHFWMMLYLGDIQSTGYCFLTEPYASPQLYLWPVCCVLLSLWH